MRQRFWLAALDVAFFLGRRYEPRWLERLQLWLIGKASDATDWGEATPGRNEVDL